VGYINFAVFCQIGHLGLIGAATKGITNVSPVNNDPPVKKLYTTLFHHKYGMVVEKQAINKTKNPVKFMLVAVATTTQLCPICFLPVKNCPPPS